VVAGWGHSGGSSGGSNTKLREKVVTVLTDNICARFDPTFSSLDNVYCSGTGACHGDFGGPMICLEENANGQEEPVIRGLMSHTQNW